jgi:hypothetical protein
MWMSKSGPKRAVWFQLGGLCLAAGLMLWLLAHPSGAHAKNYMHLIDGFLVGFGTALLVAGFGS